MTKTLVITATVQIPQGPNFLRYADDSGALPLSAFSDDDLRRVGRAMTENLLTRAAEQRKLAKEREDPDAD